MLIRLCDYFPFVFVLLLCFSLHNTPVAKAEVIDQSSSPIVVGSNYKGTTITPPIRMWWNSVPGAVEYGVEIINSTGLAPGEANNTVASINRVAVFVTSATSYDYEASSLLPGLYYYRIIAWNRNNQFISGFSNTDSFIRGSNNPGVTLISDFNGASLSSAFPRFTWNVTSGAGGYGIELLDNAPEPVEVNGMAASIHRLGVGITTQTTWNGDIRGLSPGTYHYRVIAWTSAGRYIAGFSDSDSFVVPAKPTGVELTSAYNGATLTNQFPVFSWNTTPGATGYGIELLDDAPEPDEVNDPAASIHRLGVGVTKQTAWTGDIRGLSAGTYFYRVIAWNADGFICGFSNADSFKAPRPVIYPVDMTIPDKPIVTWDAINGADGYLTEITDSPPENPNGVAPSAHRAFSTITTSPCWTGTTRYLVAGNHYVRVQALKNGSNLGGFSDALLFYVDPAVVYRPLLTSSLGGALLSDQFPILSWTSIAGANQYGVELLSAAPDNPDGNSPSLYRLGFGLTSDRTWTGDTRGLGAGTFYYRVIAKDGLGYIGSYSSADSFTLPKPTMEQITWNDETHPVFRWTAVNGANKYNIELLNDLPENPNGTASSVYRLGVGTTAELNWPGSTIGLNGRRYYVRTIATNDNGLLGGYSDTASFDVIRPNLNPVVWNGLQLPYLSWSPVPGAAFYGLELLSAPPENPNGKVASGYRIGAVGVIGTSFQGNTSGMAPGTYYWRVIAADAAGNYIGTFSNAGSFFCMPNGPKSIDINLSTQTLTCQLAGFGYRSFLISTGRSGYETPTGHYSIGEKFLSIAMGGADYFIPDVPYAMHVFRGYYIHGCYWHNNFGTTMSHGCINLSVPNAAWLFEWTPSGTPVYIHY